MKIVLTGGGTAGHISPHLALMPELKKHFSSIIYIGSEKGMEKDIIRNNAHIPYFSVTTTKFDRVHLLSNFKIPFLLKKGIAEAKNILQIEKPDIVFSKGGYVSLPVVFAAKKLHIPVVSHESDLTMGLANKLMKKSCNCICTTFALTSEKVGSKGVFTGSPVREDMQKEKSLCRQKLHINSPLPVVLITGGSMGALAINDCVRSAINELTKSYFVLHLTGKGNVDKKLTNIPGYRQVEFTNEMPYFIGASDVVISRAGSNTIFELALCKKPMLLIPLSKRASRGDQIENAKYFKHMGYANVLQQEDMTKRSLIDEINQTYKNREVLIKKLQSSGLESGNKKIVDEILKTIAIK